MSVELIIPLEAQARMSFETLGEPERYQNDPKNKPRWGITFLIPMDNPFVKEVEKALKEVAKEKWKDTKVKGGWEAVYNEILLDKKGCCWIEGSRKGYNGYDGMFALTAYRDEKDGRPLVIDNDGSPFYDSKNILVPGKGGRLFAGCFVRGQVEIWAQDNTTGKGIRAGFLQVQRVKKGDAFGGASAPVAGVLGAIADDDDDIDDIA